MQKIDLSRGEIAVWGGVIGALVLLGIIGILTRRAAMREEKTPAFVDPYRAEIEKVDRVQVHTRSAHSYEAEGSTEMAIREYRELVNLDPDDITAHGMLSALYFKTGDRDRAVAEILEVLRIDPSKWAQREMLAETYCEMGDYARASREYEEVLRYTPDSGDVHCKLGRIYYLMGQHGLARDTFGDALEDDPNSAQARLGIGLSCAALGERQAAERELALLKEMDSETARMLETALRKGGVPPAPPACP